MPLPEIKHPVYKLVVPSTNKTISYRPYTVQEEKLLLMVRMSDDLEEVISCLKQIVRNCVFDDIDVDKLAIFDIEYIFVNLRKVSISNEVDMFLEHEKKKIPFKVDLNQVKVKFKEDHSNLIKINDSISIKMRYPNLAQVITLEEDDSDPDKIFSIFIDCIVSIMDENKSYSDFTKEELETFVLSLPMENTQKMTEFFRSMPVVELEAEVPMPDGTKKEVKLSGLKDFFTL